MPPEQLVILGLLQGLTEFLPISSSGHLALAPHVFGWADQGLAYDIAAHGGSLVAVVAYFRRELGKLVGDAVGALFGGPVTAEARLFAQVMVATIPVCVVGLLAKDFIAEYLRSVEVIATTTIVFGVLLALADRRAAAATTHGALSMRDALLVGFAQVLALVPGTSRSGITMTAGLALGHSREDAARFSFLLSVPVIILAAGLEAIDLATGGGFQDLTGLAIVFVVSALSAFGCIWAFLAVIARIGMLPFALYRGLLGVLLLVWL